MPRVFLSRKLKPTSPFHQLRKDEGWELEAKSLLQFTPVIVAEIPVADWLFFYSAMGVDMFFMQKQPRPEQKLACLGNGAVRALEKHGFFPDFKGDGNPIATAEAFRKILQQESVLFVQARQSRASVATMLGAEVAHQSIVVYDNQPLTSFELAPADYLIFTSPLNFQAYHQRYSIQPGQRIIGIGHTTAETFSEANVKEYRIAHQPSEASLLACLLTWEQMDPLTKK
ncbi:uroporphyrinogen-III synthase [Lewinella sp. LCG006]|uniref:uroporphyrinogen-III synthase n=1 Tax=Lewinella sp. LCG006 TaxID=3231911 RepID=UPI0034609BFC